MIRHFCDICGEELSDKHRDGPNGDIQTTILRGKVLLKVQAIKGGYYYDGSLCMHCILDALMKLDDRKKKPAIKRK